MRKYRSIEIDFDIHKLIETERQSFDESPNDVLRRLLKLGDAEHPTYKLTTPSLSSPGPRPNGRPWVGDGVTLPHGTAVRMTYSGRAYEGQINDGTWIIDGQIFDSPSGAASGIAITRKGTKTRLDGWIYWHVRRPEDARWVALQSLRPLTALA